MPGFGAILSNIGIPLANTVAANNFAQKAEDDKQRQIAMTALAQMRQERIDAQNAEHVRAQDDYLNRGRLGNGLKYINGLDDQGLPTVYAMPTTAQSPAGPTDRVPPPTNIPLPKAPPAPPVAGLNAPVVPRSTPSLSPPGVNGPTGNIDLNKGDTMQGGGQPVVPPQAPGPPPQSTGPRMGQSTGITPIPKPPAAPRVDPKTLRTPESFMVNGNPVKGFADKFGGYYDQTGQPIPKTAKIEPFAPPQTPVIMAGQDSTGKPTAYRIPKIGGPATPVQGFTPNSPGATIAPLALTNFARFKAAVPTLQEQNSILTNFEDAAEKNPNLFTGFDEFKRVFYKLPDHMDPKTAAEAAIAQSNLNSTNPQLARYIRAGARWSFEDGTIQQRTTDKRMLADEFISTIGPNMGHEGKVDTQNGRLTRLQGYAAVIPTIDAQLNRATGGRGGNATAAPNQPSPLRVKYDAAVAALKAQGLTQPQIDQRLGGGPPP